MSSNPFSFYWSVPEEGLRKALGTGIGGLTSQQANRKLKEWGRNQVEATRSFRVLHLVWSRFSNPLLLILVFAASISMVLHDWLDATIILLIVSASVALSIYQEYRASDAITKLRNQIALRCQVMRDGKPQSVSNEEIVPGDIVLLSAGNLVPADGVIIEQKDLFINQSLLSGETFPVEKQVGLSAEAATLNERKNLAFMGTSVSSGSGKLLIVHTGQATELGKIAAKLSRREPETEFEKGLRHFGTLLMQIMVVMVLAILAINILVHRATIDTFLFAIALAVGLSPELLPAIFSITLARGSQKMAAKGVIVKRLNAIENLGGMDILCTDKTGTLTKGVVQLDAAMDVQGEPSASVRLWALLNARLQTGLPNSLDLAIVNDPKNTETDLGTYQKIDEIPYDFQRRRLSIVVGQAGERRHTIIMKGALKNVLEVCDRALIGDEICSLNPTVLAEVESKFISWSQSGFRVLGIAQRPIERKARYTKEDENSMIFSGFLLFFDPPEPGVKQTLSQLLSVDVRLKIITGDNHAVARYVAEASGLQTSRTLTGSQIAGMNEESLWHSVVHCDIFAEVDPNQKERIVRALQKNGHVVGFLGDGINDAPALHAADVGISVDCAVDVAKEAADFVLLKHDLNLLLEGIQEGRHTFANTLKYVFITTSANFGNMISMATAAIFLPFLPLLAKQVLLNNFISDIPAMGLAGDNVDREWNTTPHRWDIGMIRSFMISFGLISTLFDFITFGVLLYLVGESASLFRTGWFVESLLTELFILIVIRTYHPFYRSRPSKFLIAALCSLALLAIALPYLPFAGVFNFVPLPPMVMACILLITFLYILMSEVTKRRFYRRFGFGVKTAGGGRTS